MISKIRYIIIIMIMASIPIGVFAINLNTFTILLTNFNNSKTVLETAKILSQIKINNKESETILNRFKANNKSKYQNEIMVFSRSEDKLSDAYNLVQAYYYLYGNDYWYKIMVSRISNKLILSKTNDTLLKSIFINENFDLFVKNVGYVSKQMYKYHEILSSLLSMYKWKIKDIYASMQKALKDKDYDSFLKNYKILSIINKYPNVKKAIGLDYRLPQIESLDFQNLNAGAVEIFKYFPKLFYDLYNKNLKKAKEDFQNGMYSDTINILTSLIKISDNATNLLSDSQKDNLQSMLTKATAVRNFILGISDLYLKIQRANNWEDFKNILNNIYKDFDTSYIVYFDHAFINGKLTIIFKDYKKNISNYMKIKQDNGEEILPNIISLYNETELIISKIQYNDVLKDKLADLSKYFKDYIQEKKKKKSKDENILISSIVVSTIILTIILLWLFLPITSKANFFSMIGMNKTALSILQKHLVREAENPKYHLTIGEIYEKLKRNKEAEYHYRIAMQYYKERRQK